MRRGQTVEEPRPYHITAAEVQALQLKERVAVKLALAIDARRFSQRQAAAYLGVSQPRVSDLMRGRTHLFSLDTLIEWMLALDQPVTISFDDPAWGRSNPQAMSEADWRDQIAFYAYVIKHNPRDPIARQRRASAHTRLQQYDEAIRDYTAAIEIEPESLSGWYNRASVHGLAGQPEACIADCDTVIARFLKAPSLRGGGGLGAGGFAEAGGIYSIRAGAYAALKKYRKALADYKRAIAHDPMRPGPYVNRARLHLEMERPDLALADYERARAVDPTDRIIRRRIGELKKQLEQRGSGPAGNRHGRLPAS